MATVLSLVDVHKAFGTEVILSGVSFMLNEGDKMALVGRNGAGKSTLMRAIAGQMEVDSGRVAVAAGSRVAYLSQDPEFTAGNTLYAEAMSALGHLRRWEEQMRRLEERMAGLGPGPELDEVMADYGKIRSRYEAAGGYEADARVRQVLFGLGFAAADLELTVQVLSGGQKVRLGLARLLLGEPDILLLDEPTNHLDLQATEWLEAYLKSSRATAIIVSHDRYFLDAITARTLELEDRKVNLYHGNYSRYLVEREQRLQQQYELWQRQQEEAEKLRDYIRRYMGGNRTTRAKSREKKLNKMELMDRPRLQERHMRLNLDIRHETGAEVLEVQELAKAFDGGPPLFAGVNLALRRGERVALVGPNGAGKTTFLKVVHGLTGATAGQVWWGVGVQRGYFSQDLDQVNPLNTVIDEMLLLPGMTIFTARSLLARFLFIGDDVMARPIAALSGGERNRLTLAKLMLGGANVLLLDEPTNHLDLAAKEVLEEALLDYPGTLLFVSHDRYFIDRLATRVWEFDGGTVREFAGNYTDYRQAKAAEANRAAEATPDPAPKPAAAAAVTTAQGAGSGGAGTVGRQARAQDRAQRSQRREEIRRLESAITQLEERKAELTELLADPDTYRGPRGRELAAEYQAAERELARLYLQWEAVAADEEA